MTRAVGHYVADLTWPDLDDYARRRTALLVLDSIGCACAGHRLGGHAGLLRLVSDFGGATEATRWIVGGRVPAAHAALVNGAIAHHVELDDGNPRASLHGGVTIVPAAMAVAEQTGANGRELLLAIAAGYGAAVACGGPLVEGIGRHRLHPPAMSGSFGAVAAAARLLGLSGARIGDAIALAGMLLPVAPFEAFTKGATVKDLYAGWPALLGVTAAHMAAQGLPGPDQALEAPMDGLGRFLLHGPVINAAPPVADEIAHVHFKAYATCRSVHPTLTVLESLTLPDWRLIEQIVVETYPFAVGLSEDSDASTPIGAKVSIPYSVASYFLDGRVDPEAFTASALVDERRRALAERVQVRIADDMIDPVVRGARVRVRLSDGGELQGETRTSRWAADSPATEDDLRAKFRRLVGPAAQGIEEAVNRLAVGPSLGELADALGSVAAREP